MKTFSILFSQFFIHFQGLSLENTLQCSARVRERKKSFFRMKKSLKNLRKKKIRNLKKCCKHLKSKTWHEVLHVNISSISILKSFSQIESKSTLENFFWRKNKMRINNKKPLTLGRNSVLVFHKRIIFNLNQKCLVGIKKVEVWMTNWLILIWVDLGLKSFFI